MSHINGRTKTPNATPTYKGTPNRKPVKNQKKKKGCPKTNPKIFRGRPKQKNIYTN